MKKKYDFQHPDYDTVLKGDGENRHIGAIICFTTAILTGIGIAYAIFYIVWHI